MPTSDEWMTQVRALLHAGEWFRVQEAAAEALREHPGHLDLLHALGLSLANVGALEQAFRTVKTVTDAAAGGHDERLVGAHRHFQENLAAFREERGPEARHAVGKGLDRLADSVRGVHSTSDMDDLRLEELLGLRGRIHKSLWERNGKRSELERSRWFYLVAFLRTDRYYCGINAAATSRLLGDNVLASVLAEEVLEACAGTPAGEDDQGDYWKAETIGQAYLLVGLYDEAEAAYQRALDVAATGATHNVRCRPGTAYLAALTSTRRQLNLLRRHGVQVSARLLEAFRPPEVVVFAGHMIDRPNRDSPHFPPELEDAVRKRIRSVLDDLDAQIGYSSAACGGDLLFVEEMLDRGAEVNVVLPFRRTDFEQTSVSFAGRGWRRRLRAAISHANTVTYATDGPYLGDEGLFGYANEILVGKAILRAHHSLSSVRLVALCDGATSHRTGSPADILSDWPDPERSEIIDLAQVRTVEITRSQTPGSRRGLGSGIASRDGMPGRKLRCLLFADLEGYSKLGDEHYLEFERFFRAFADRLRELADRPDFERTSGDAIFAVTDDPRAMAKYAIGVCRAVVFANNRVEMPTGHIEVRIAVHAAPIFDLSDPITGRGDYFGSHVNRTARLEPVTAPGQIYATEQFVALLMRRESADRLPTPDEPLPWVCELVGKRELAKDFGTQRVYHLSEVPDAQGRRATQAGDD